MLTIIEDGETQSRVMQSHSPLALALPPYPFTFTHDHHAPICTCIYIQQQSASQQQHRTHGKGESETQAKPETTAKAKRTTKAEDEDEKEGFKSSSSERWRRQRQQQQQQRQQQVMDSAGGGCDGGPARKLGRVSLKPDVSLVPSCGAQSTEASPLRATDHHKPPDRGTVCANGRGPSIESSALAGDGEVILHPPSPAGLGPCW